MKNKIVYLIIIFIALILGFSLVLGSFGVGKKKSSNTGATGILRGKVTVGPICPVERVGVPCPVPPAAYTSREVVVYLQDGVTEFARKNFNPDGTYSFELPPGDYIIGAPKVGIGGSKDLPHAFSIKTGEIVEFNFSIDTGIR